MIDISASESMESDNIELTTVRRTMCKEYDAAETCSWRDTGGLPSEPAEEEEEEEEGEEARKDDVIYQVRLAKDTAGTWEVILVRREKPVVGKMERRIDAVLCHNSVPMWYQGFSAAGFVRSLMGYQDTSKQGNGRSRSGSDPGAQRERGKQLFWNIMWNEWLSMSTIWRTLALIVPNNDLALREKFEVEMKNLDVPFFSDDCYEETSFIETNRRRKKKKSSPFQVTWNSPMYTIDEQHSLKLEAPTNLSENSKQASNCTKLHDSGTQDEKMVKLKLKPGGIGSNNTRNKSLGKKQQEAYRAWNSMRHNHIPFVGVWGFNNSMKTNLAKPVAKQQKPKKKAQRNPKDRLKIYPTNVCYEDASCSSGNTSPDTDAEPLLSQKTPQKLSKNSSKRGHTQHAGSTNGGFSRGSRCDSDKRGRSSSLPSSGPIAVGGPLLARLPKGREYRSVKTLVIGDSCVGKTKFITRLVHRQYLPDSGPTLGGRFYSWFEIFKVCCHGYQSTVSCKNQRFGH